MVKKIPEYPDYYVSRYGRVWSTKTNKWLKTQKHNNGRGYIAISNKGISKKFLISRLVCRTYGNLPNLESNMEVDHLDSNPSNDYYRNLDAKSRENHLDKTLKDQGLGRRTWATCSSCGVKIQNQNERCWKCHKKSLTVKSPSITVEDIEYWVKNFSWVRAAKELGLSDTGLRKRYKRLTGKNPKDI